MAIKGGTIITKVALDDKGLKTSLDGVKKKGKKTATEIERAWKSMGKKSDQTYDTMRANINKNYNTIKNHAKSTAADIVRAEKAKALKISRINKQQFGEQHKFLNKLKANWKSYGLVAVAAIGSAIYATKKLVDSVAEAGDQLHKMSLRTGVTVEELSALGYAAEISGTNIETVEKSLRYASKVMVDYSRGIGLAKRTFEELGLAVVDSTGRMKTTPAFLMEVADKLKNVTDETKKAAFISEIFGAKAGTQLLPLLRLGGQGIRELMNELDALGGVMTTQEAQIAADYTDAVTKMGKAFDGVKRVVGTALLPVLKDAAEQFTAWTAANKELIKVKAKEWIEGTASSLKTIADALSTISRHMDNIARAWKVVKMLQGWAPFEAPKKPSLFGGGSAGEISGAGKEYIDIYAPAATVAPGAVSPPPEIADAGLESFKENEDLKLGYFLENLNLRLEGVANYNTLKAQMDKDALVKEKEAQRTKKELYATSAGMIAGTFRQIAEAGATQSKEAFRVYQAFAIVEAIISANLAAAKVLGQTGIFGIPMSAIVYAQAMTNVAMIASAKPPSYDEGGISSAKGIYQTGNINEAHIPLKGGKVPVKVQGSSSPSVIIHMDNPTFQDVATQRQVFMQLAEIVAKKVAPGAVVQDYSNDGQIRQMIRGRL